MSSPQGTLYVVATPIGNLDDITYRAVNTLKQVQWVACEDTRHSQILLQHFAIHTPTLVYHEHNESKMSVALIKRLLKGESGAVICDAGTPLVSDPGYTLTKQAHENDIRVVPVPGACAAIACLSAAGLPSDRFLFEGFLPAKAVARQKRLRELSDFPHTLLFYESPHRIQNTLQDLKASLGGTRTAVVARELTKRFETIQYDSLDVLEKEWSLAKTAPKGEFVVGVEGASRKIQKANLVEKENDASLSLLLKSLLDKLSVKDAAQVAAEITGLPKKGLYKKLLMLEN